MNRTLLSDAPAARRLGASIEISAKQALDYPTLLEEVPVGSEVYLPDFGREGNETVLNAACRLASLGYNAIPHIATRRAESLEAVEYRLRKLKDDAGITKVLVIAGDQARPLGPLASTMDLLRSNLLEKHGFNDIRIAGHPEGSKDFGDDVALDALLEKIEFGKKTGTSLKIVTQFGFDAQAVVRWCQRLRMAGIDAPIDIGVAGPARLTTLIKYAAMCGVGNSASFLLKRSHQVSSLMKSQTSEALVRVIESSQTHDVLANINAIHVFAFGGIRSSSDWLVERGSWNLERG